MSEVKIHKAKQDRTKEEIKRNSKTQDQNDNGIVQKRYRGLYSIAYGKQ